jgi:hypothetical protein
MISDLRYRQIHLLQEVLDSRGNLGAKTVRIR